VVGFVTNAGFVEANTADGLRKCLADEFSSIYVFHLRGNQRTQGETSRKEGGKIFGSGSRAPIAITFLVKNPKATQSGQIFLHDIGDYLSREEKLQKLHSLASIAGIEAAGSWQQITPDEHGDWLNQRVAGFDKFLAIGDKRGSDPALFENYSLGVSTNRDVWAYHDSKETLAKNFKSAVTFYNGEVNRIAEAKAAGQDLSLDDVRSFVDTDPTKFGWDDKLFRSALSGRAGEFSEDCLRPSLYRPFNKRWLYFNRAFITRPGQHPRIFPEGHENRVILVNAAYKMTGFVALMSDITPDLHVNGDAQAFPLYWYGAESDGQDDAAAPQLLLGESATAGTGESQLAITDAALAHFRAAYPDDPRSTRNPSSTTATASSTTRSISAASRTTSPRNSPASPA
jgi:predicted helicase